jgi:hypothetical protein
MSPDDAAMKLFYGGIDQFPAAALQPRQRADLILAHEAAVANHVDGKYCGEPSLHKSYPAPSMADRGISRAAYSTPVPGASVRYHASRISSGGDQWPPSRWRSGIPSIKIDAS